MPDPAMPMQAAAMSRMPLNTADLMPPMPQAGPAPAPAAPATPSPAGPPPMSMPPPLGMPPQGAGAPPAGPVGIPPFPLPLEVKLQDDGSSIYLLKGSNIVLSRNEPPKIPKALQPPRSSAPAGQPQQ